ncbi:hypothetical protein HGB24_01980 [Candidatus Saccharibacteria bacterium]|nr:hypothetical protein [Candidatus Saccharibacteria bacterium]
MSNKKRNKKYSGIDAAMTRPKITRISAANRSAVGQWWFDRKSMLLPILKTVGVIIALAFIIYEIIRLLNGQSL